MQSAPQPNCFRYSATERFISLAKSELYFRLQKAAIHSSYLPSGAFAENNVSLESIIQKNTRDGLAEVVWLTHEAEEAQMRKALDKIGKIPMVDSIPSRIRVI